MVVPVMAMPSEKGGDACFAALSCFFACCTYNVNNYLQKKRFFLKICARYGGRICSLRSVGEGVGEKYGEERQKMRLVAEK